MNKNNLISLGLIASVVTCTTVYQICKIKRELEENEIMNKAKLDAANIAREAMEQEHKERMKQIQDDYLKWKEDSDKEFEEWKENFNNKFGKIEPK